MLSIKLTKETMSNPKIELSDDDAKKWLLFQKHYGTFMVLVSAQVFEQKNATINLFFDQNGILQTVHREDNLYRRSMISTGNS